MLPPRLLTVIVATLSVSALADTPPPAKPQPAAKPVAAKPAAAKPAPAAAPKPATAVKAAAKAPVSAKNAKSVVKTEPLSDLAWHVSAGYIWRNLGNLSFSSNPRAQGYALPAPNYTGTAGTASGLGGHTYNNGFVNADDSSSSTGDTWFWGYNNDSQLNGTDLSFSGTALTQTRSIDTHPGWSEDMAGGGPILSVGADKALSIPGLRVGAEFSVSLIVADQDNHLNTLRDNRQMFNVTDHYMVDPLGIPSAPFTGSLAGPGPIIPAAPSTRDVHGSAPGSTLFIDDVHESLDLTLTTLSLGPTASYERGRLKGTFGLGFALNIASWDADKTDTLYQRSDAGTSVLARWHDGSSGTDVLAGFYLQASATYAINDRWSVQAFGRYDWSQALEGEVGGSKFSLDLTGWSVGGGVVYRF
jgi:hypothetical protein